MDGFVLYRHLAMSIDFTLIAAVIFTLFTLMLIPIYWKNYGPDNFLWLSDIGLFMTVLMLWLHSPLFNSMVVIGIMPLELVWMYDYFYRFITNKKAIGISDYMFEKRYTLFLRSLSLFHIVLPVIWLYYLFVWGYNPEAPVYQTVLTWAILLLTYFCTDPKLNVNWVFYPQTHAWKKISARQWLLILLLAFPLGLIWPMHWLVSVL